MRPLIIYYSRTQNTVSIATEMAKALSADMVTADRVSEKMLWKRKLIGLGSGIYGMKHDKRILEVAKKLSITSKVFIFSTNGFRNQKIVRFAQSKLRKILMRRHIDLLGQWNCPGHDKMFLLRPFNISAHRPNDMDVQSAKQFAEEILKRFNNQ